MAPWASKLLIAEPASSVYHPSPVCPVLRQQILLGNYVDLVQLLQPSIIDTSQPREIQTNLGLVQLRNPSPTRSKNITPTEFALAFSLYRGVICSVYPTRRTELDEYLRIELDMALRFGGLGFYTYHVHFTSQAAGRIKQFNQGTYWGALDSKLYCRIFAARASLSCQLCGAPSHPALACLGGRMACNNFNDLGCSFSSCRLMHICSFCGGPHARSTCPHNPTTSAD
ncbi:hypothetical protein JOQ06_004977 [Pogonophryne albipinna]|uniref:Uncharacterized protein n=1 Tax=Pogonophryne albipinna TaxID=1090488 RepID=A0AAD6FD43_9TELE|nr:hypothetical protein JOQ06_004977 [Pogonophryne albipinna]